MTDRMTERRATEPPTKDCDADSDFGETLALYSLYSAEALLRNYFGESAERVAQLRDQMIASAVCGNFSFTLDLAPLLVAQAGGALHPLTERTLNDETRFKQTAAYLCQELLGVKSGSLTVCRTDAEEATANRCNKGNMLVRFHWTRPGGEILQQDAPKATTRPPPSQPKHASPQMSLRSARTIQPPSLLQTTGEPCSTNDRYDAYRQQIRDFRAPNASYLHSSVVNGAQTMRTAEQKEQDEFLDVLSSAQQAMPAKKEYANEQKSIAFF